MGNIYRRRWPSLEHLGSASLREWCKSGDTRGRAREQRQAKVIRRIPILCEFLRQKRVWNILNQSDQSLSHVQLFPTPWTAACQPSLSINNSQSLLKFMSIESVMLFNHLIFCCLLLLPSIFPSIRVFFKWVSSLHQVAKILELQFQHQSFQWIFRTDFLQDSL